MQTRQTMPHTVAQKPNTSVGDHVPQRPEPNHRHRTERLPTPRQRDRGPTRHHTDQDRAVDLARGVRAQRERSRQGRVRANARAPLCSDARQSLGRAHSLSHTAQEELRAASSCHLFHASDRAACRDSHRG